MRLGSARRGWLSTSAAMLAALAFAWSALLAVLTGQAAAAPFEASHYRIAGDATHVRMVIDFDREPDFRWFLLRAPHRLVIDLGDTRFAFDPKDMKGRGLIKGIRYGQLNEGTSRLILSSKGPFVVEKLDVLQNESGNGVRLVADIAAATDQEFESALSVQAETTGSTQSTAKGDRVAQPAPAPGKRFSVVIDPGHGGIDGGAEGPNGTVEKDVTLTFAKELRDRLAAEGTYDVYMTRETDEFLRLDDRVRIARQHGADLFISIHADTINLKGIRGATVYTVSEKASDAAAQALADRENLSDQLAGIAVEEENHEVADILIDLIRRETHTFSMRFARSLVGELSTTVGLINNPHRSAGFKVLKAPDVPSVLVELGYLSNTDDEAQLRNPEWRGKAAASICNAIALFAAAKTGAGG